jgi:hypothetical protein
MRFQIGFPGLPVSPFSGEFEGNIATPPSSAEVLRKIAESIEGDDPMKTIFVGVLRKAANELKDWEWLREHHGDINCPILVGYPGKHGSLEEAIDAARKAGAEGR